MNDSNSMRAHVRRSALRGGDVRLTSVQIDALADELACNGATISAPLGLWSDDNVGVVDGRRIILDESAATPTADVQEEEVLRISTIKREGQRPLVVVIGKVDVVDLFDLFDRDKLNRLIDKRST